MKKNPYTQKKKDFIFVFEPKKEEYSSKSKDACSDTYIEKRIPIVKILDLVKTLFDGLTKRFIKWLFSTLKF